MSGNQLAILERLKGKAKKPKGRSVENDRYNEILRILGDAPRAPDLLIEHLHKIQDAYGYISAPHLAALATEMKLSQTEVFEVATFLSLF